MTAQDSGDKDGLVGYSLSFCVSDILRGTVKEAEVTRLIASTNAPTREDFEKVLDSYATCYWSRQSDEGKAIARRLWEAGKIDQPRTRGEEGTSLAGGGHWKFPSDPVDEKAPDPDSIFGDYVPGLKAAHTVAVRRAQRIEEIVKTGTVIPVTMPRLQLKKPGG